MSLLPARRGGAGLLLALCVGCYTMPALDPVPETFTCGGEPRITDTLFLIGDTGDPELPGDLFADSDLDADGLVDPVLESLNRDVSTHAARLGVENTHVVFLGDNVYPKGLPPEGDPDRARAIRVLEAQIASVGSARTYFILGNHDWEREGRQGWEHAQEQRRFFEPHAPQITLQPPGGCAGPTHVDVGSHLRLVFMDLIGWQHAADHPDEPRDYCPHQTSMETFFALANEFDHPDGRHVVFLSHHPLRTAGPHGGHFGWQQYVFPLTDFWSWAWLPLPVIGAVYPLSRKMGVTGTDLSSKSYYRFVRAIERVSRPRVPMMVVGGHEHSLQLHQDEVGLYYAVSGAGSTSKIDRVRDRDQLLMAVAEPGYMRLDVYADGALGLEILAVEDATARLVYRHCVATGPAKR